MSYILDALKKVEREKVKKALPGGMTSIAGDLFMGQAAQPARSAAWKIAVLVIIASLVTFAGTWLLLKGTAGKETRKARPAAVSATLPAPAVPPPVPAVTSAPVPPHSQPPAAQPVARAGIPPVVPTPSVENPDDDEERAARREKRSVHRTAVAARQAEATLQAPADITLSGIAWQEERSARRAVVNGFLLKEGAVVSGSRITDILADRVRFSSTAGNFEIRLNAVVPEEVKR